MMDNKIDEVTLARLRKQRAELLAHSQAAPGRFLAAWIAGIRIVGKICFTHNPSFTAPASSLDAVTDKWQVIPDRDVVNERIGMLSSGEAALLAVMCSFYNAEWGGQMMQDLGIRGMADISAKLDLEANHLVADLLVNYTGW